VGTLKYSISGQSQNYALTILLSVSFLGMLLAVLWISGFRLPIRKFPNLSLLVGEPHHAQCFDLTACVAALIGFWPGLES